MTSHVRTASALAVAAGCLVLGSTAGAVAGAKITSAQIKDGTITSIDVKNGTLRTQDLSPKAVAALKGKTGPAGPAGAAILGREEVNNTQALGANSPFSELTAICPTGKVAIGGAAFWTTSSVAVQFTINPKTVRAFTPGIPNADTLNVRAICVNE